MRLPVFLVEDGLIRDAQVRRLREKRMSGKTFTAHIFSRARVATTSPSLRKPRARLPHSVNVPKRTFTPFGTGHQFSLVLEVVTIVSGEPRAVGEDEGPLAASTRPA